MNNHDPLCPRSDDIQNRLDNRMCSFCRVIRLTREDEQKKNNVVT